MGAEILIAPGILSPQDIAYPCFLICFICSPINNKLIDKISLFDGVVTCTEGYKDFIQQQKKVRNKKKYSGKYFIEKNQDINKIVNLLQQIMTNQL